MPSCLQLHAIVQQADEDSVFVPLQGVSQAMQLAEQGIQLQAGNGKYCEKNRGDPEEEGIALTSEGSARSGSQLVHVRRYSRSASKMLQFMGKASTQDLRHSAHAWV